MPVNGLPSSPSTISLAPPVEAGFEGADGAEVVAEGVVLIATPARLVDSAGIELAAFEVAVAAVIVTDDEALTGFIFGVGGGAGIAAPAFEADGGLTDTD